MITTSELSPADIEKLRVSNRGEKMNYYEGWHDLEKPEVQAQIKGRRVIDLGSGTGRYLPAFFQAGCSDLLAVEPKPEEELAERIGDMRAAGMNVSLEEDAYTFWERYLDDSAIVTSWGVFCRDIFGVKDPFVLDEVVERYFRLVARHIERITPGGAITIHRGVLAHFVNDYSTRLHPASLNGIHSDWSDLSGGVLVKR